MACCNDVLSRARFCTVIAPFEQGEVDIFTFNYHSVYLLLMCWGTNLSVVVACYSSGRESVPFLCVFRLSIESHVPTCNLNLRPETKF